MSLSRTYPSGSVLLLAGTKRGLFLLSSQDRQHWTIEATKLETQPSRIFYAAFDPRNGYRIFVADNGDFFGSFLRYSDDFGQSWQNPRHGIQFPATSGLKLQDIWIIEPGRPDEPETLYAGTDPACLWVSHDRGESWEPNMGLLAHPERARWESGAGGTCLHSIIADPTNASRLWVGISGAGTLRSDDNGQNWYRVNHLESASGKDNTLDNGSHRLVQHTRQPETLYQQSRGGIFKTLNGGESWLRIGQDLPSSFGFPLTLDVHHPDTLFVEVIDPQYRYNLNNQFAIYRSKDGGENWETLTSGLPGGSHIRMKMLRHGLCSDTLEPCGVYAGTTGGQIFASHDCGDHWQMIANYLPPIYSVTATVIL